MSGTPAVAGARRRVLARERDAIRAGVRRGIRALDLDARDLVMIGGIGCVGAGVWIWSPAAALVTVGAILIWLATPPATPPGPRPVR